MKIKKGIVLSAVLFLTLCACLNSNQNQNKSSSVEESSSSDPSSSGSSETSYTPSRDYVDKDVNIIRSMNANKTAPIVDKKISLRFFNEMPSIPYIKVSKYFTEFFNTRLNRVKDGDTYKYSMENGQYIAFNPKDDLFSSLGLLYFNEHPDFKSSTGKLFIRVDDTVTTPPSVRAVPLKNYSIDIKEGDNEAYVPVSFLSKLAGGFQQYNAQYNGKDIYVIDEGGQLFGEPRDMAYYGSSYYEVIDDMTTPRAEDMIEYSYGELCFVFDNLRGYTSQLMMGDNNLLSLGLNGVLERFYPTTKAGLFSSNKAEYDQALYALFFALFDGGHTGLLADSQGFSNAIDAMQSVPEYADLYAKMYHKEANKILARSVFRSKKQSVFGLDAEAYRNNRDYYYYDSTQKTAVIGFDSFRVNYAAWDDFYNGKGEIPVESDTYAFIRSKLYKAKEDGAKNLVFDLTSNGGGDTWALCGIVGLLNGAKADFDTNDTFNKYHSTEKHSFDINLDGKFDNDDVLESNKFDFNIGVLTSNFAFSCGNLMPSVMKELGYKILGEKSGGGSCAIIVESTAEGVPYVHSSYLCLTDSAGNNIDDGVPVDYQIDRIPLMVQDGIEYFYADNFYNIANIASYLNTACNS